MRSQFSATDSQYGFTVIELLIAMAVVSVILLMASIMMTNIGSLYYKGISQSRAQDNVRAIIDEVSQHLQLNDSAPTTAVSGSITKAYCIGTTRYTYVLGKQLNSTAAIDTSSHVLWRDTVTAGTCAAALPPFLPNLAAVPPAVPSANGTELMAPRSRLTNFTVSLTSPYTVTVDIAFGDTILLCDSGTLALPSTDCTSSSPSTHIWNFTPPTGPVHCKGSKVTSSQKFCGTANLTTTVVQRLH